MKNRWIMQAGLALLVAITWMVTGSTAKADGQQLPRYSYYPYYYFPHNYWPQYSAPWPEKPGQPYQKPPAYMAYPPFKEPGWRYELWSPMKYYRGMHFWLDQF
ncbi:hypothetical protein [Tuwongella immobilis]|uniref:Uncharacterized protein n=1 Tax=Tuwongella immobilis TaxID=692036 RepID=A0A6C2YIL8_9BACT|nr:hypothetical protein [Tuwongella immobilis]VIP01388.1 Putative uncharacterized protein OS=uncultured planctomycete GN=HGMM_F33C03C07 PE=4 SV=1 [Tuwongella immobilis]VTR98257.1 Putative uncharacterized protein OS=uncultured planctomycete GN=HGMM_F33C03C07 PE=4 SV=1 [Tuwongella immobilis]